MIVELINTGSELMLGRVLNTHQQWLCRQLADLGYVVTRQVAVADTASAIQQAVGDALSRADLVITTGGLGPTSDDLTRDVIAAMFGRRLREEPAIIAHIEASFARRKRVMPDSTRIQAQVPEGAAYLMNQFGTAPGLVLEINPNPYRSGGSASRLIMLPGPPRELRPMFKDSVVPLLPEMFPLPHVFVCRTLRTMGIGESMVQERIEPELRHLTSRGLEIGYCARPGQTDVRLDASGDEASALVSEAEKIVKQQLASNIYGSEDQDIEEVVVRLLKERRQTLALAESCTGGAIADRLTNIPGASAVFLAGFVTYSNEAKMKMLGVREETLAQHGAVSEATVLEMAEAARRITGADHAIAVSGIAGPDGGTPDKPVGTVFLALSSAAGTQVRRILNPWDRLTFKEATARQALNELRISMFSSLT